MAKAILITLLLLTANSFADEKGNKNNVPLSLNYQNRTSWSTYNECYFYGGFYYGDSLDNSYVVGADYLFHFSPSIALGPTFQYLRAKHLNNITLSQPGFFSSDNIYVTDLALMLAMPAAFAIGRHVVEADLFALLAVGGTRINASWEPHGVIGGGMKIYLFKPWSAIRVDLRSGLHSMETPTAKIKFEQDLNILLGISLQIPPRIREN